MLLKAKSYHLKATLGFTLIELLVVIAIIGLLSSIVLASLGTARSKAADAAIQADLVGVRSAAEIFYADNGSSYGLTTSGTQYDALCLGYANPAAMLANTSIKRSMQEAYTLNGSVVNGLICAVDPSSYAIAIALKTQNDGDSDPTTMDYFCIDGTGNAKITNESFADSVVANPSPHRCL
ncbi:MAG TPA: type II secretion system protein [Candidatus Paceibacterota bacterium]